MATDIARLGLKIEVDDIKAAVHELDRLEDAGKRNTKGAKKTAGAYRGLRAVLATLGVVALTRQLISQVNAYQNLTNQLKNVTKGAKNLADIQRELFNLAQDTRGSLDSVTNLYSRLARSTESLGLSQTKILGLTKTISQAFVVSGASAQEASNATIQLGQALGAGALRGDEFRSVAEQGTRIIKALSAGLGVTRGELKKMADEGKLTTEIVVKALSKQAGAIQAEFDKTEKTVSQAFQQIENSALRTFGSIDSRELVGALDGLRETLEDPAIANGLQTIASGLLQITSLLIKATAGIGNFINKSGQGIGILIAQATGAEFALDRMVRQLAEAKEKQLALAKVVTASGGGYKYQRNQIIELEREIQRLNAAIVQYNNISQPKKRLTEGATAGAIAGDITKGGPTATDPAADKAYQQFKDRLDQQIYLHGQAGEAARVRYEIEYGALKKVSAARQQSILALAQEYDKRKSLAQIGTEAAGETERLRERLQSRYAALNESFLSEAELETLSFQKKQAILDQALALKLTTEANYKTQVEQLEEQHQKNLNDIKQRGLTDNEAFAMAVRDRDLRGALSAGAKATNAAAQQSKKMFNINKALALATAAAELPSAIISSFKNGGGYPWGLIPAGLMAAQGAAQINAIKSAKFGGGSSAPSVGGGGAPQSPGQIPLSGETPVLPNGQGGQARVITINLGDEDRLYSKQAVRNLMEQIAEETGDNVVFT